MTLLQSAGIPGAGIEAQAAGSDSWLFLAYMSADEAGSPLNWSADINEMESGLLSQNITIIALVDPPGTGDSKVYKIAHDPRDSDNIVSQTLTYTPLGAVGEAAMGEPGTLISFAEFAIDGYYQGGGICLILWGHGNGWMGVCQDKGSYLEPKELAQAMGAMASHLGRPLDLVIFDACDMGSFEVLPLLAKSAHYSVSSEIQVPEYGFPYDSVLVSMSVDTSMSALEAAKIFADEYVRYGALVADVTSQAAVIDLETLQDATVEFDGFCEEEPLFIALIKPTLDDARSSSYEIGGNSVDLIEYLADIAENASAPERFSEAAGGLCTMILKSIAFNRVFISPTDYGFLGSDSFQGLSIFFPNIAVQMDGYRNSSDIAATWSEFLANLHSGTGYTTPQPGLGLTMKDLRYGDGLADSFSFIWNETAEIDEWSCDALEIPGRDVAGRLNFSDSAISSGTIGNLTPGYYEVCAYGIASDGKYRYYGVFEDVAIMRRFTFDVHLPEPVPNGDINITNLRTGESVVSPVSGGSTVISFLVPSPCTEGDRVLLSLERDNVTIARGLIILSGDATEVYLVGVSQPGTLPSLFLFLLVAALIVSAFIKLRGADRRHERDKPKWRRRGR